MRAAITGTPRVKPRFLEGPYPGQYLWQRTDNFLVAVRLECTPGPCGGLRRQDTLKAKILCGSPKRPAAACGSCRCLDAPLSTSHPNTRIHLKPTFCPKPNCDCYLPGYLVRGHNSTVGHVEDLVVPDQAAQLPPADRKRPAALIVHLTRRGLRVSERGQ